MRQMLEIEGRTLLQTEWKTHLLTAVALKLIGMALEEPLNTRFVLLFDSDIVTTSIRQCNMGFKDCSLIADAVGDAFADKGHSAADGDGA